MWLIDFSSTIIHLDIPCYTYMISVQISGHGFARHRKKYAKTESLPADPQDSIVSGQSTHQRGYHGKHEHRGRLFVLVTCFTYIVIRRKSVLHRKNLYRGRTFNNLKSTRLYLLDYMYSSSWPMIMAASIELDRYYYNYASSPNANVRGGEAMHHELLRLNTFAKWPPCASGWPSALAHAGFYFEGNDDETRCFSCKGTVRHWVGTDDPFDEHRRLYPRCPFLLGEDKRNIALEPRSQGQKGATSGTTERQKSGPKSESTGGAGPTGQQLASQSEPAERPLVLSREGGQLAAGSAAQLGIITARPRHPEYAIEYNRLQTFTNFPRNCPVKPDVLAKAGFYFTGSGDCVRCFFCDVGLRHWETGDDPWEEHARWYPRCNFILCIKGESYIQQVQQKYGMASTTATTSSSTAAATAATRWESESGSSWLDTQLSIPPAKSAMEMGYSRFLVSIVLEKQRAMNGTGFTEIQSLLEAIFDIEESGELLTPAPSSNSAASTVTVKTSAAENNNVGPSELQVRRMDEVTGHMSGEAEASPPAEEQSILEENRQLREQKICKICMDKDANLVFLPCGHLCCCSTCAPALRTCPICRQNIRGTVRIYIS